MAEKPRKPEAKPWYRSKTVWTGIGFVLYGVIGGLIGRLEFADAVQAVISGLAMCGLRFVTYLPIDILVNRNRDAQE